MKINPEEIKKAREVMRKSFEIDKDFEMSYIANIAILLEDRYYINPKKANSIAKDLLDLIFAE